MSAAMSVRRFIPVAMHALAGALCLFAFFLGVVSLFSERHVASSGLALLYSIPLLLLLPIYCVSFARPRTSAGLQATAAIVFTIANILINLEICGHQHVCASVVSTIIAAFLEPLTLTPFLISVLQGLSIYMREAEAAPISVSRFS